jgi:opacity protein-like surface antigen
MYESWNKSHLVGAADLALNLDAKARSNFQTLFFNAYWDFHNSTAFTPYIGAGVGLGFINNHYKFGFSGDPLLPVPEKVSSDSVSMNNMNTVFAWNVGAGCSYAFNENFSADLAYRFVGLGYNETSKTFYGQKVKIGTSPYANEFSLGLRYTF